MTPFLAINTKGGESISPKQKDHTAPPHHQFQKLNFSKRNFQLVSYYVQEEGESSISKMIYQNPLEH
jgi:hypothetical protein